MPLCIGGERNTTSGVLVKEGESGGPHEDIFGLSWIINGERATLDLRDNQGILDYGDYPDVLSRLYGALYSQDIPTIVITARPRYLI